MTTLSEALEAFHHALRRHLVADQTVQPVDCEVGLAEDGTSVVVMVDLSDGECICGSFDATSFDAEAREFTEIAFYLRAAATCKSAEG